MPGKHLHQTYSVKIKIPENIPVLKGLFNVTNVEIMDIGF